MKNTKVMGWGMLVALMSSPLVGGCDLVAGIGEFCEIGVDCEAGGTGGGDGGGGTGGTTSPTGGGGTGGAPECSSAGTKQPCYTGPDGTEDIGICAAGEQTCQADGTWSACGGEILPGVETCASTDDEDCDGNECAIWSQIFGDSNQQFPLGVAVDGQGDVVLLGHFKGTIDLGGGPLDSAGGSYDLFLAKFKADGQHVWSSKYGDSADQLRASLALDSNDNIFIGGGFEGTLNFGASMVTASIGGTDAFVVKLTPNGTAAWAKSYGDSANQAIWGVALDSNEDVLVIGEFAGSMLLKNNITAVNGTDVWVGRFDGSSGAPLGQIQFDDKGGQSGTLNIGAGPAGTWAISGLHGNNATIAGATLTGIGSFVAKYGPDDMPIWSVSLPLSTPAGALIDSAGDVVVSADFSNSVDVAGQTLTSKGIADIALVKLTASNGAVKWVKDFGGDGNEQAARLAADMNGDLFFVVAGDSSEISFGGPTLPGKGLNDVFVVALDGAGSLRWSRGYGDATSQTSPIMALDPMGKALVIAAQVSGTINFGAGDLNSNGNDIALARLAP